MWYQIVDDWRTDDLNDSDAKALIRLTDYALSNDTGGLVHYEIAAALVPSVGQRRRLHRAGVLHTPIDVPACGCGVRAVPGHWSLHPHMVTPVDG